MKKTILLSFQPITLEREKNSLFHKSLIINSWGALVIPLDITRCCWFHVTILELFKCIVCPSWVPLVYFWSHHIFDKISRLELVISPHLDISFRFCGDIFCVTVAIFYTVRFTFRSPHDIFHGMYRLFNNMNLILN